ncbi:MAG: MFS transporter [Methanomassiliicoccus sp.]|nr:MFS transporter [Methanomassiliicoccus sp.]
MVAFFVMMGVSIIAPVLPSYGLSFGVSLALVGLLISAFAVARVLLDIPAGLLSARYGMKRLMLLGLATIAVSSLLAGVAVNYPMLLCARIFEGVGSALYTTTSITAVSRLAPPASRGAHLSFYLSMFLLGTSFGPAVGGFVSIRYGLSAPFIVYGICAAASFFLVLGMIREVRPELARVEKISLRQLGRLMTRFDLLAINLATFAIFINRQGILNTIVPLYAQYNLGMDEGFLGLVLTLSAICNLVMMVVAGRMTDRYGRKPFLMGALLLLAVLILALPFTHDPVGFTAVLMAMGLSVGLSGPIAAWVADVTEPRDLGAAMGLFRTVGDLGFVIAPVALASLAGSAGESVGFAPFLLAGGAILLLSLPLLRARDPAAARRKD